MNDRRRGNILVVDDDDRFVRLLRVNLEASGYSVVIAKDGQTAIALAMDAAPDLILLDIMMPGMNGYAVWKKIRGFSTAPIIMLTALDETDDMVKVDLGADDYIGKPVSIKEVLARVNAALRRSKLGQPEQRPAFEAGNLRVDFVDQRVFVSGQEVKLTPIEYRVLGELVTHAERVLVPSYLLERVWGIAQEDDSMPLVWQVIHRLRRKIEVGPDAQRYIHTRPGIGHLHTRRRSLSRFLGIPHILHQRVLR